MPMISRAGIDLYYHDSGGEGPVVVLQHPLTASGGAFRANGTVALLEQAGFRCIMPDSIAHGKSGRPRDPRRYDLAERCADVMAVVDHAGIARFHFVGYSMGAWIGTGMLQIAPDRLHSALLAGWDPIDGATLFTRDKTTEARAAGLRAMFRARAAMDPAAALTPEQIDGIERCYLVLFDAVPGLADLARGQVPIAFYCGDRDPYCPAVRAAAAELGAPFRQVDGDHASAFFSSAFADFVGQQTSMAPIAGKAG